VGRSLGILSEHAITYKNTERGISMDNTQRIAEYLGRTRTNPALKFSPAMLNITRSLAPSVTATSRLIDFKGSTAVGGKRGTGGRVATLKKVRPANYVPHGQRQDIVKKYRADVRKIGKYTKKGKNKYTKGRDAYISAGGKFPEFFDVGPSVDFDAYAALCTGLDVPLGTFVDSTLWGRLKGGLKNPGFSKSELASLNAELGLRGDAKLEYNTNEAFLNHPRGRMFNVPYEDRLRGSVLTVLGIIPLSSRNLSEVLNELDGKESIGFQGTSPQALSRIVSLAQRRSELAPSQTASPSTTVEEAPLDLETASGDEATDEDSEDTPNTQPKSNKGLIIGGTFAAVIIIGGASYYFLSK